MQITIKTCYINDKNKSGEPYIVKNGDNKGQKFFVVALTTTENTKAYCNIYQDHADWLELVQTWKSGMVVDVLLTQDGEYSRFEPISEATQAPNSTPKTENTNVPTQTSTAPQIAQISPNTEAHELSLGMLKILQSQNATIIKLLVELKDIVSRETLEEQDEELVAFIDEKFGVAK